MYITGTLVIILSCTFYENNHTKQQKISKSSNVLWEWILSYESNWPAQTNEQFSNNGLILKNNFYNKYPVDVNRIPLWFLKKKKGCKP